MKRVLVIGGLVAILLSGCAGGDRTETVRVARIGDERVVLPDDTPRNVFGVTRALLDETPFLPWYKACIMGQARRIMTASEAQKFPHLPQVKRDKISFDLMMRAGPHCEEPGRDVIDPDATQRQFAILREQTSLTLAMVFEEVGASQGEAYCVEGLVDQMTDGELVALGNDPLPDQEQQLEVIFESCTS